MKKKLDAHLSSFFHGKSTETGVCINAGISFSTLCSKIVAPQARIALWLNIATLNF
jgi:hypothetical protein